MSFKSTMSTRLVFFMSRQKGPVLTATQDAQARLQDIFQLAERQAAFVPRVKVKLSNPFLGTSVERVSENYLIQCLHQTFVHIMHLADGGRLYGTCSGIIIRAIHREGGGQAGMGNKAGPRGAGRGVSRGMKTFAAALPSRRHRVYAKDGRY
jgi:protein gp37